jgi:hypothetical protein
MGILRGARAQSQHQRLEQRRTDCEAFRSARTQRTSLLTVCEGAVCTRDIEVVMVSGTGRMTVSVPVFIIETWHFPLMSALHPIATKKRTLRKVRVVPQTDIAWTVLKQPHLIQGLDCGLLGL